MISAIARGCYVMYPFFYVKKGKTNSLIRANQQWPPPIIFFIRFYRHYFHCNLNRKNSYESTPVFFSGTLSYNGFVCDVLEHLSLTLLWLMANVSCLTHSCSLNLKKGKALVTSITSWFLLFFLKKFQQIELHLAICWNCKQTLYR